MNLPLNLEVIFQIDIEMDDVILIVIIIVACLVGVCCCCCIGKLCCNKESKGAVVILEGIGNHLWGFKPNIMKQIVSEHGHFGSLKWFINNMPFFEATLKRVGGYRVNLIAAQVSALNGCPYCTFGHAYAWQLYYFKKNKKCFPIDEMEIKGYCGKGQEYVVQKFRDMFDSDQFKTERNDFERTLTILNRKLNNRNDNGDINTTKNDSDHDDLLSNQDISHLIDMFIYLNTCSINGNTPHDQAHDPINKDLNLRKEYKQAREKLSQSNQSL